MCGSAPAEPGTSPALQCCALQPCPVLPSLLLQGFSGQRETPGAGDGQSWGAGMGNLTRCKRKIEGGRDLMREMMRMEWETEGEEGGKGENKPARLCLHYKPCEREGAASSRHWEQVTVPGHGTAHCRANPRRAELPHLQLPRAAQQAPKPSF